MKNAHVHPLAFACIVLATSVSLLGCAADVQSDTAPVDDVSQNVVAFSDAVTDSVRFEIVRHPDRSLGMSLTGTIGKDDHKKYGAALRPSFVETYLNLHPNLSEAPAQLRELEKERTPIDEASVSLVPKDVNSFLATECKDFDISGTHYYTLECDFNFNFPVNFVKTSGLICPAAGNISFFWNESSQNGTHYLENVANSGYSAPAYTWGWHNWSTNTPCAKTIVYVPNSAQQKLGVTRHAP